MMRAMLRHPVQFMTDHRFTRAHASDFLDGDLDADGRTRVERHAHWCPKCAELINTLRRTMSALRELGTSRPDTAGVADGVLARLRSEAADSPPP